MTATAKHDMVTFVDVSAELISHFFWIGQTLRRVRHTETRPTLKHFAEKL